jgi:hypothetical protein
VLADHLHPVGVDEIEIANQGRAVFAVARDHRVARRLLAEKR